MDNIKNVKLKYVGKIKHKNTNQLHIYNYIMSFLKLTKCVGCRLFDKYHKQTIS